jgi:hypothetical protein
MKAANGYDAMQIYGPKRRKQLPHEKSGSDDK